MIGQNKLNTHQLENTYPTEQIQYSNRVSTLLFGYYEHKPKAFVQTYGCQQNVSDSERIKGMLKNMGYTLCDSADESDFILFNTCAVRAHAEDRVFGNLGALKHLKRRNPKLIIAVCGCMAQQESVAERIKKSFPYVNIVFGTHVKHRLPEFVYNVIAQSKRVFELSENNSVIEGMPIHRDGNLKGWLPIMHGCNNFCTYCIVPYVRGRERSRDPEQILAEAKQMVKDGFKEITLLGQNVNSYGKEPNYGVNFAQLLRRINDIPGDFRIRFMTSHPKDCTIELLDAMRDCEKVAKHLHLPFQCGSDKILKAMNRRYTANEYLALIDAAKERMPDISLTSDIIVGFPGETYEDFKKTIDLIRKVRFMALFTFIYSPRPNTPAAIMDDPISRQEKGKWFSELLLEQEKIAGENSTRFIGKTLKVICDDYGTDGFMLGHTDGNAVVKFKADESVYGKFVNIKINTFDGTLIGTLTQ